MKQKVSGAFIYRLRLFLPLPARARPDLLRRLRQERPEVNSGSLFYVSNVYEGGEAGLMCAIKFDPDLRAPPVLVAPLDHVVIDRYHPLSKEVSLYQRGPVRRP